MAYGKPSYRFSSSQLQAFLVGLVAGAAITVFTTRGGNLPPAAPAQAAPAWAEAVHAAPAEAAQADQGVEHLCRGKLRPGPAA